MKYLGLLTVAFFCTLQTFGQQDYFMYLQTDDNQAFYVRLRDKVYSSTGSGYLILSRLPDSTSQLIIGFPKNLFPEQHFGVPVDHRDAGYLLKNFGDKGWGLFNLQTAAVIMSSTPPEEKKSPDLTVTRKNDAFSLLLANAVNDSAVLLVQTKTVKPLETPVKKDSIPPVTTVAVVDHEKKPGVDSTRTTVKPIVGPKKDSAIAVAKQLSPKKDTVAAVARNRQPVHNGKIVTKDSTASVARTKVLKTDSSKTVAAAPKKPLGIFSRAPKERKDTIIMMSGGKPVVAKNTSTPTTIKKQVADSFYAIKPKPAPGKDSAMFARQTPKTVESTKVKTSPDLSQPKPTHETPASVLIEKKPETAPVIAAVEKKDTLKKMPVEQLPMQADSNAGATTAMPEPPKRLRPLVNKAAEVFTDTSYVAVFVDESQEKFDTIRLSIPFFDAKPGPAVVIVSTPKTDTVVPARKVIDSLNNTATVKTDSFKTSVPLLQDTTRKVDTSVALLTPVAVPVSKDSAHPARDSVLTDVKQKAATAVNANCHELASENDIDKLRVKMLLMENDEEKIGLAKKLFQQRCVLTKQVRALSELFKTDEAKYKWFDAAYPFVSDLSEFPGLGELIKDSYYLNRFKAMLRN